MSFTLKALLNIIQLALVNKKHDKTLEKFNLILEKTRHQFSIQVLFQRLSRIHAQVLHVTCFINFEKIFESLT